MKKKVLLIASVFAATTMFAQDLTSKKGETILPEADDWAIGFDAAPFLNYVGNFLNSGATSPTANFTTSDLSIMGKMFVDANTAYRGRLRLGFGSTSTDVLYGGMTGDSLTDNMKASYNAITLGGGLEKRRGNTRIQGVYGGEALIMLSGSKNTYEYGESLDATSGPFVHTNSFGQGAGVTEMKNGSTFGLALRGFIGVEIFVFPKVSVAAEYGWGLGFSSTGEGETTVEALNGTSVESTTSLTGGGSSFGIDTDNNGGELRIMFHF